MRIRRWEGATHRNHGDLCSPRFHGLGENLGVHSMHKISVSSSARGEQCATAPSRFFWRVSTRRMRPMPGWSSWNRTALSCTRQLALTHPVKIPPRTVMSIYAMNWRVIVLDAS